MLKERYRLKLEEELGLLSSQCISIGTNEMPAYFFQLKDDPAQCILQLREEAERFHVTYSVLVKSLNADELQTLPTILAKNWDYKKIFLWPMEINERWYLLASIRQDYESYLPGQIRNQLSSIFEDWLG